MTEEKKKPKDNEIFVGKKEPIVYATAVATLFNKKELKEITVKARGRQNIATAIEGVEMARNKFVNGVEYKKVNIGSEETDNRGGRKVLVTSIEIVLIKK